MSVKSIIAETLISKGVGHILPSSYLKKATTEARHNYSVALHKLEKLQSRRTPNMKLIRNAKSAMREARALYGTLVSFTTGVETVKKKLERKYNHNYLKIMVVNKMEYKQVCRYLLLMISGCIIYLFYSIIVVYYDQYSVNFYAASASKLNISLILSLFNVVFGFFSNTSIIRCT